MKLKEEMDTECIEHEEIIIHPRDYSIKIRKKLFKVLKKLGISFKKETTQEKTKGLNKEDIEKILGIEVGCCNMTCNPCTYPNCQRFVREQQLIQKRIGYIKK